LLIKIRIEPKYLPSSKPFATPEKLHTAVQKKSQVLKISGGQAFTASMVALTRLGFPMVALQVLAANVRTSLRDADALDT
jgi:hypothetical protein